MSPDRVVFASPLVTVGMFRCPTDHPRFADSGPTGNYCFVYPRSSVWIQHEGQAAFVTDPTVVTMYNPAERFRRQPVSAEGDRCEWFAVAPAVLREALTVFDAASANEPERLFRFTHAASDADTYRLQRAVFRYARGARAADALFVEEAVVTLLSRTLAGAYGRRGQARPAAAAHAALAERAREFLNEHYAESTPLAAVARACGCSEFHLCRVFRAHTGLTLHACRHELRLRRALEDVDETPREITDIALAFGYATHSHFTAAFRRLFGVTPSAVRRHA